MCWLLCIYSNFIIFSFIQKTSGEEITTSPNTSVTTNSQQITNITVYPVVAIVVVGPILAALAWCWHKKKCFKKQRRQDEVNECTNNGFILENEAKKENRNYFMQSQSNERKPSSTSMKWEIPRHKLRILDVLGEGFFGKVLKAEVIGLTFPGDRQIVAVKTLKDNAPDCDKNDLINEIKIMTKLGIHPHVVTFYGFCTSTDPIYLIMEFVSNSHLQGFLRKCRQSEYYKLSQEKLHDVILTGNDLTSFAYQVAQGMQYIGSKGLLHRDLATRNVLLGHNNECKICDFGLAREAVEEVYIKTTSGPLPVRWMAPESLRDFIFTVKTDVWAFGILMWEIITFGSTPYADVPVSLVIQQVQDGYRLPKPDHCKRELYNHMYYCWDVDPDKRPSFAELCNALKNMILTKINYVELEKFQDSLYYNITCAKGERL